LVVERLGFVRQLDEILLDHDGVAGAVLVYVIQPWKLEIVPVWARVNGGYPDTFLNQRFQRIVKGIFDFEVDIPIGEGAVGGVVKDMTGDQDHYVQGVFPEAGVTESRSLSR